MMQHCWSLLMTLAALFAPGDPAASKSAPKEPPSASTKASPPHTEPDTTPTPSEEDPIPGLPQGEAPPLPEIVNWRLANTVLAENQLRKRISLGGWWRFAASAEREGRVVRSEMGWLQMPDAGTIPAAKLLDPQLRPVLNEWRGQSLEKLPWLCIERDLSIPAEWVNTRIYLRVAGPWKNAEVFSFDVPIDGFAQGAERWFDLTENLAYAGTVRLDMRLKRDEAAEQPMNADKGKTEAGTTNSSKELQPYIGLELTPIGPRVQQITLRNDAKSGELEATFDLARPPFFLRPGARPIHEVPLALHLELRNTESGETIAKSTHLIGKMPEQTKTTAIRLRWPEKVERPKRASLHAMLTFEEGGKFDIPFPVEFEPAALPPVAEPNPPAQEK